MNTLVRTSLLLAALSLVAAAADFNSLEPQGFVNDFARVLSPNSRRGLEDYCIRVEQATGAQIALVTIPSLDGEPIEDVANLLYRRWGVGSKSNNEGVLVLLVIQDRRSRVEVGYGLEPVIPDGFAGSVLRSMRTPLRAGQYDAALAEAAMTLGDKIADAKGVRILASEPRPRTRQEPEGLPWHPGLIALGVLAFLLLMGGRRGGRGGSGMGGLVTGMILGQILGGHGSRSSSGGGFGGYDSHDSFGGFGGGDSGGGGASSDW